MHRVVIVGCGFAGLFAAKTLRRAPVEVVVVDRTNHHLFQALLYQVATGVLSEGDIAPPIRDVLRRQRNTRVVLGDVVDVDVEHRRLMIAELEDDDAAREAWLTFAIVGAGPTGVELAGQIAELSRRALGANFRRFDPKSARIILLDALDT